MRTLVWAMIRLWRSLFPPYSEYWRLVDIGWSNERRRLEIVQDIKTQPFLRGDLQARLLEIYEAKRDKYWKRADELMCMPGLEEL